jgi:hypothetical protein
VADVGEDGDDERPVVVLVAIEAKVKHVPMEGSVQRFSSVLKM